MTNPKALRIAAVVAAGVSAMQFSIWLGVWIVGGHLANPWWLWGAYAAGGLIVVERVIDRRRAVASEGDAR